MILLTNIKDLLLAGEQQPSYYKGNEMGSYPRISNAFLCLENGKILDYGPMNLLPEEYINTCQELIDAKGRYVLPAFVDPHSHIVYEGSRESEFVDKIKGLSYEEIAKNGGGILQSAKRLAEATEDALFNQAYARILEMKAHGTAAIEIKSGYGLALDQEIKMLRVIRRLKQAADITIKATFLGAHAFPKEKSREAYLSEIIDEMLPAIAEEGLADYCDVFCDRGFFTPEETDAILKAGSKYGLQAKIHANELDYSGGVQVGVANNALSVDHLECVGEEEIEVLLHSKTMPTLLPGTAFFLRLHYPPARKMIDAGLPIALATDYNPGSSPSGNMEFVLSLACIQLRMLPEEALCAATFNAAYAMGLEKTHGRISKGYSANVILTKEMSSLAYWPYSYGKSSIERVFTSK